MTLSHRHEGARALLMVLALFAGMIGSIQAQTGPLQPSGPPIVRSIEVEYSGPAIVAKERILAQMRTKIGEPYSDAVVESDIRQLYTTGQVRNVRIFAQPEGDGVKVIVAIQTRSVVRELEIDGAHKLSAKRLRKEIGIKIGSPVKEETLEQGRQKVIEAYQGRGFTDINVQFRVDPIDEAKGEARVVYTVEEGIKGAVKRVKFEGNTHFKDSLLTKEMKTRGKTLIAFIDKSGRLDEVQLQRDIDSIKEFYQNHGYIDVEVSEVRKERRNGPLIITIGIVEGAQYHVGRLSFAGNTVATTEKLSKLVHMKPGDVYSPKQLRDDAKLIADGYGSGGFVDLMVAPQGTPTSENRIDVHYKVEEGNRSFVQRITIVGNTRTKDKVLRREVLVRPGDVFDTVRVDYTKKRLENLGYFSKVEAYPEETGVPGRKDLVVQVEEKRTGSLSFGGGFSTVDQLVVFAELSQGNFDIANWPGFTGAGQKFRLRAQIGTVRKDFILAITEPYFMDRRLSLGGQLFYTDANYLSSVYDQRNYGASVEARRPLWAYTYGTLGYRVENIEIYNVESSASQEIADQEGTTLKSTVLSSIVWDRRDNPLLSRTGQRIAVSPFVSGGFLGGDVQIYGGDLEASQYFHLPLDMILLFNGEAAIVNSWGGNRHEKLDPEIELVTDEHGDPILDAMHNRQFTTIRREVLTVPIFDRLYLGGSNNLRGFTYRDVGPRDEHGEPTGGRTMARGTIELTFPIIEKARGAFFVDRGYVDENTYAIGSEHWGSDFGFGLRLDLPIGPLRVDYGIPIERDGRSGSGRFNFNVGYQF